MIKKHYHITIRDYNLIEQTGRFNHLTKLPVFLVKNRILKEIEKLNQILNNKSDNRDEEELIWKLQTLVKINAIESSYLGIINILNLGSKITIYKALLSIKFRRKININDNSLNLYKENIKKYTGIEIKKLTDVERIRKDLMFRKDKFNENYGREKKQEKVFLMTIALGVFSYLNQPINLDMTVMEFSSIKKDAYEKLQKEKINK